ncbi:MAG: type II secretion system protein [Patescibacteria group bacterium]|jgi:prepilin-type N-terminal cleavage/methylation domain-containing protein|nr:type II secretion system protein [Patescibacteria group bacterium]
MIKNKKNQKGFTLVELLVVIAIIGILASMSTVSVNLARVRARDAKRQADISQIQLALYLYFDDNLHFPAADLLPENAVSNWNSVLVPALNGTETTKVYMALVPGDPLNMDPHFYGYNSDGKEFIISYYLENEGPRELHGY